jgi:MoxR-like ATPase
MQEHQVTVEGTTRRLSEPFHVLATANPIEYEGTYPLPEAQLDRFLLRISFGYLDAAEESEVLARRLDRRREEQILDAICDKATLVEMQQRVEYIAVEVTVRDYIVAINAATRDHAHVLVGASPRGALAMLLSARACAAIDGREFVTPDDVKAVAVAALAHRITLRPETYLQNISGERVVQDVLKEVPLPSPVAMPDFSRSGRAAS